MWLIFITEDAKTRYMIEVHGSETLEQCVKKVCKMHPISVPKFQLVRRVGSGMMVLTGMTNTINELNLRDQDVIHIESERDQKSMKNAIVRSISEALPRPDGSELAAKVPRTRSEQLNRK